MKRVKTKLPWALPAIALAALLVYGFWPEPVEVDIVHVTKSSLDVTVNDDGETRIREKYIVSAPVAGKLLRVQLHAGDVVKQGVTELAHILPSDPELLDARTRAETEARLRASEALVQQTQANSKRAEETLELAEQRYERAKRLLPQDAISLSEFDSIEHDLHTAQAEARSADFAVKVADFELEHAQAAAARYAEDQQDNHTAFRLVSPIEGRVLRVFKEDAGVVTAGTSLLELGDPQDLEIEIDVLSSDAVSIQPGDKVLIEHWGGPNALEAVVRIVEPSAFLKISALGVEEKRVNVIADFVDPWSSRQTLADGFRIEARIVVASTGEDSLQVPAGSLFRDGDTWNVYRVVGGVAELCSVQVGISNGLETEIKSGLSEGDAVILHPTDQVKNGVRVTQSNVSDGT